LDNLGFDCSTTQHHPCQPSYIFIALLDATIRLVRLSTMRCSSAATILSACAEMQPLLPWSVVRHGAEELQLSHEGVPTTWIEDVAFLGIPGL
jgi:hypothetical protein